MGGGAQCAPDAESVGGPDCVPVAPLSDTRGISCVVGGTLIGAGRTGSGRFAGPAAGGGKAGAPDGGGGTSGAGGAEVAEPLTIGATGGGGGGGGGALGVAEDGPVGGIADGLGGGVGGVADDGACGVGGVADDEPGDGALPLDGATCHALGAGGATFHEPDRSSCVCDCGWGGGGIEGGDVWPDTPSWPKCGPGASRSCSPGPDGGRPIGGGGISGALAAGGGASGAPEGGGGGGNGRPVGGPAGDACAGVCAGACTCAGGGGGGGGGTAG